MATDVQSTLLLLYNCIAIKRATALGYVNNASDATTKNHATIQVSTYDTVLIEIYNLLQQTDN
jgi:hypothetical protein